MRRTYKEMLAEVKKNYAVGYAATPPNTCFRNGIMLLKKRGDELSLLDKDDWKLVRKVYRRFVDDIKYQSFKVKPSANRDIMICIPIPRSSTRIFNLSLMDEILKMTNTFEYYGSEDSEEIGTIEILDEDGSVKQVLRF